MNHQRLGWSLISSMSLVGVVSDFEKFRRALSSSEGGFESLFYWVVAVAAITGALMALSIRKD